jgi:hypothetical protein
VSRERRREGRGDWNWNLPAPLLDAGPAENQLPFCGALLFFFFFWVHFGPAATRFIWAATC